MLKLSTSIQKKSSERIKRQPKKKKRVKILRIHVFKTGLVSKTLKGKKKKTHINH